MYNNNMESQIKIPEPQTYHEVFAPEFARPVKITNHEDGTEMCNNWHHKGRCYTNCKRTASHNKKLSEKDIETFRKYMLTVYGNWSMKNKPAIPQGFPPAEEKKQGTEDNSTKEPGK